MKRIMLLGAVFFSFASSPAKSQDYYLLVAMNSQKCAHVLAASRDNGGIIAQWDCGPQDNFKWRKKDVGGGYFQLQSVHSNKCIHVSGARRENGVLITQWDCWDQPNFNWKETLVERSLGHSFYHIVSQFSGKCLHVLGASGDNGGFITQWDCVDQPNVKWAISERRKID